jgi:hypothetical protein
MSDALIERARKQATCIHIAIEKVVAADIYDCLLKLVAEISALREERDRLRAALRGQVIGHTVGNEPPHAPIDGYCAQCHRNWPAAEPESHEADCLAALGERSGERE